MTPPIAQSRLAAFARHAFGVAALAALLAELGATAAPAAAGGCGDTDFDGDGLACYEEDGYYHTDPNNWDSDGDGVSDGDEVRLFGTSPIGAVCAPEPFGGPFSALGEDLNGDTDGDGLTCREERYLATDPNLWDTDFDGYGDGDEAYLGSNPLDATSVPDGLAPDERR